jgi:hypothetical protein
MELTMSEKEMNLDFAESDLIQALFAVSALVANDVIQKAKQYNTLLLITDEDGNIQRLDPKVFELEHKKGKRNA